MPANYKLTYLSPTGIKLKDNLPFLSLEAIRSRNEVGKMAVRLRPDLPIGYLKRDGILQLWRSVDNGPYYLEGETDWLINRITYRRNFQGLGVIEAGATDMLGILKRRRVAYDAGSTYTSKVGFADDLIKAVILENYGVSAIDAARNASAYLSVAGNQSQGGLVGDDISWKYVLDAINGFADASDAAGVKIIFDIVRLDGGTYEFRTYKGFRGVDHSRASGSPLFVDDQRGNLTDAELEFNFEDEVNYIYAAGKGEAEWRPMKEASDAARIAASPFARSEGFVNASNTTDLVRLQSIADRAVAENRPKVTFSGQVLDTPKMKYGIHFHYGDLLTVQHDGWVFDAAVNNTRITVQATEQGVQDAVEIRLKGETYA